jgi:hypothetical protein
MIGLQNLLYKNFSAHFQIKKKTSGHKKETKTKERHPYNFQESF